MSGLVIEQTVFQSRRHINQASSATLCTVTIANLNQGGARDSSTAQRVGCAAQADYVNMLSMLERNSIKKNLQPLETFFIKIIQLYEMIIVRHGLMLVGYSFSMKTCAIRVLQDSLHDLHVAGLNDEFKVKTYTLNPKAITMGQLYGQDDPISQVRSGLLYEGSFPWLLL